MSRQIDAAALAELDSRNIRWIHLVDLQLDGGSITYNSSLEAYAYDSKTFLGAGNLGSVGAIEEGSELDPRECSLTLSAVNQSLLATILSENYVNRRAIIYVAILDEANQVIGNPFIYFDGLISGLSITYGKSATILVSLKDRLALWNKAKVQRYTHQEQVAKYPGDMGFEFVNQIADKEIVWPTAEYLRKIG